MASSSRPSTVHHCSIWLASGVCAVLPLESGNQRVLAGRSPLCLPPPPSPCAPTWHSQVDEHAHTSQWTVHEPSAWGKLTRVCEGGVIPPTSPCTRPITAKGVRRLRTSRRSGPPTALPSPLRSSGVSESGASAGIASLSALCFSPVVPCLPCNARLHLQHRPFTT